MLELLVLIRTLYFLKHNCHNLVSRISFFADHEFLGESYEMSLKHYDDIVERMIGLGLSINLLDVQQKAVQKLAAIPIKYKDNAECFAAVLAINKMLCKNIDYLCSHTGLSEGTKQLLGGIADQIEVENYKLQQRIKK